MKYPGRFWPPRMIRIVAEPTGPVWTHGWSRPPGPGGQPPLGGARGGWRVLQQVSSSLSSCRRGAWAGPHLLHWWQVMAGR